jgi:hypothetical protein
MRIVFTDEIKSTAEDLITINKSVEQSHQETVANVQRAISNQFRPERWHQQSPDVKRCCTERQNGFPPPECHGAIIDRKNATEPRN